MSVLRRQVGTALAGGWGLPGEHCRVRYSGRSTWATRDVSSGHTIAGTGHRRREADGVQTHSQSGPRGLLRLRGFATVGRHQPGLGCIRHVLYGAGAQRIGPEATTGIEPVTFNSSRPPVDNVTKYEPTSGLSPRKKLRSRPSCDSEGYLS